MSEDNAEDTVRIPPDMIPEYRTEHPIATSGDWAATPARMPPPVVIPLNRLNDTGSLAPVGTSEIPALQPSDTGKLPPLELADTGDMSAEQPADTSDVPAPELADTGKVPAVQSADTGKFWPVALTDTGEVPAVQPVDTGMLPAVQPADTGKFWPVASGDTGQLPPVAAPYHPSTPPPVVELADWVTDTGRMLLDTGSLPPVVPSGVSPSPPPVVVVPAGLGATLSDTGSLPPIGPAGVGLPPTVRASDTGVVSDDDTIRIPATRASRSLPEEAGSDEPVEVWPQRATRSLVVEEEEAPAEPKRRRLVLPILSVLLAVGLVAAGALFADRIPSLAPQPVRQQAMTSAELSCPGAATVAGTVFGTASGDASWQPSGGTASPVKGFFEQTVTGQSRLSGAGSLAGVVQYSRAGQVATTPCSTPAATGYLQMGAANATLVLTNIDAVDTVLNVALLGPDGVIDTPDLVDLKVAADATVEISVGKYAPGVAPVTARWQSTQGRVVALARIDSPSGFDLATPTDSGTEIVVPGLPGGTVSVMLANFSTNRAKARIDMLTKDGRLPVAGADSLTVESNSSTFVDLTSALGGQTVALVITSDQPVIASAWVSAGSDVATSPGIPTVRLAAQTRLSVAPGAGTLVVSNAGNASAAVPVTLTVAGKSSDQVVQLAAGATSTVELTDASVVKVEAPRDVVAALVLPADGSGLTIVQLPPDTARTGTIPVWPEAQPAR